MTVDELANYLYGEARKNREAAHETGLQPYMGMRLKGLSGALEQVSAHLAYDFSKEDLPHLLTALATACEGAGHKFGHLMGEGEYVRAYYWNGAVEGYFLARTSLLEASEEW